MMNYGNESYRGIAIRVINNITGPGKNVMAKYKVNGHDYKTMGDTKEYVVAIAKERIKRILG